MENLMKIFLTFLAVMEHSSMYTAVT